MKLDYRKKLFESYYHTHSSYLNQNEQRIIRWTKRYINHNYLPHIKFFKKETTQLLEIGCGGGYFLANLYSLGYHNLTGVDLSFKDIENAKKLTPEIDFYCQDARNFLKSKEKQFDIIIAKAVIEHIPKDEVLPFFEIIKNGLNESGLVIIDVPNMDWIFATHERYMDFTHEVGFTKESLNQIMSNCFSSVSIFPGEHFFSNNPLANLKRFIGRAILNNLFDWAEPDGIGNPLWSRSIIGIANK